MPYSYSQISQYRMCPARLRFYRQKVRVPEPEIMQAGALAHEIYEAYFRWCASQNRKTDTSVLTEIARRAYETQRDKYRAERKPYLTEAAFSELVKTLIIPFGETHLVDTDQLAEVEQRVAVTADMRQCDWMANDVFFRGVIDTLYFRDNTAVVVDYKTGFSVEADDFQMEIYAWLLFALYPHIETVECVFDYTRFNIQRTSAYERDQYEEIDERVREICATIERDRRMDPAPGIHCLTCQYADICEAKVEAPKGSITDHDEAVRAVESISLMERDLKSVKERLRLYCTANGNIEHNGTVWGFHAQGDRKFTDAREFHDTALDVGVDPWPYMSVNTTKAKKLLRDERLAAIAEPARTLVFAGRKSNDKENDQ